MANTSTFRQWFIQASSTKLNGLITYTLVIWVVPPTTYIKPLPGFNSRVSQMTNLAVADQIQAAEQAALNAGTLVELTDIYCSIPQAGMTAAQQQAFDLANIATTWAAWQAYYSTLGSPAAAPSHAIGAFASTTGVVKAGP